jgi:hypothetical protein
MSIFRNAPLFYSHHKVAEETKYIVPAKGLIYDKNEAILASGF